MVEDLDGEIVGFFVGEVLADPPCVEASLIHADKADGREVIIEASEIVLGVGIEAGFEKGRDGLPLDRQGPGCNIHEMVEPSIEIVFVGREISEPRHIEGDDADRPGRFARTEVAAALLTKLAKVESESATHGANVAWLHVAIDVVREIRGTVLGGHREQKPVVFGVRPIEVLRDGISWNRVLEAASIGIAFDHDFDEGLVDHSHFLDTVLVFEWHFLAADDAVELGHVIGHRPVEGDVGERRLSSPTRRSVDAIDEALDGLLYFLIGKVVCLDERSEIRIEA